MALDLSETPSLFGSLKHRLVRIIRPSLWAGLITVIKALSHLVILKFIAMNFGPALVGIVGQAMGVSTILQNFAGGGISNGIIRNLSLNFDEKKKRDEFISFAFTYSFIFCFFFASVCLIFSSSLGQLSFGQPEYGWVFIFISMLSFFAFVGSYCQSLLTAQNQMRKIFFAHLLSWLTIIPLFIYLTVKGQEKGAIVGVLCVAISQGIFLSIAVKSEAWFDLKSLQMRLSRATAFQLAPFSLISLVSGFLVPCIFVLLRSEVEEHLGWEAVGYWQSLLKISEVCFSFFSMVVASNYFPKVSKRISGTAAIKETVSFLANFVPVLVCLFLTIGLFGSQILTLVFSDQFAHLEGQLRTLLVGDFLRLIGWAFSFLLMARNHLLVYLGLEVLLAGLQFAMCWLGIQNGLTALIQMQVLHSAVYCFTLFGAILILIRMKRL